MIGSKTVVIKRIEKIIETTLQEFLEKKLLSLSLETLKQIREINFLSDQQKQKLTIFREDWAMLLLKYNVSVESFDHLNKIAFVDSHFFWMKPPKIKSSEIKWQIRTILNQILTTEEASRCLRYFKYCDQDFVPFKKNVKDKKLLTLQRMFKTYFDESAGIDVVIQQSIHELIKCVKRMINFLKSFAANSNNLLFLYLLVLIEKSLQNRTWIYDPLKKIKQFKIISYQEALQIQSLGIKNFEGFIDLEFDQFKAKLSRSGLGFTKLGQIFRQFQCSPRIQIFVYSNKLQSLLNVEIKFIKRCEHEEHNRFTIIVVNYAKNVVYSTQISSDLVLDVQFEVKKMSDLQVFAVHSSLYCSDKNWFQNRQITSSRNHKTSIFFKQKKKRIKAEKKVAPLSKSNSDVKTSKKIVTNIINLDDKGPLNYLNIINQKSKKN